MANGMKVSKEDKKSILAARKLIEDVLKIDGNEAETRRRLERIFESVMGYEMNHLSREYAVSAIGATAEYCDFAIKVETINKARPVIMVEVKRAGVDIDQKHLRQVGSYAINEGCEWILLTNGVKWQLHHVNFGQPPVTNLVDSWNLMTDDVTVLAPKFASISFKCVKRGNLQKLWEKANVLTPRNLISIILSTESLNLIRRELRKSGGVTVAPEEIVLAFRKLLNEKALDEMEGIKISLGPAKKPAAKPVKKSISQPEIQPLNTAAVQEQNPESPEETEV